MLQFSLKAILLFIGSMMTMYHQNNLTQSPQKPDVSHLSDSLFLDSLHVPKLLDAMQLVHYAGFSLQYDEAHEQARWVGYHLHTERLIKVASRSDNFRPDPQILTGTATNADYAKTGYDRGHLAPAGDMSWSEQAMRESFFYSNMSPQVPGFNRGIWKKLEDQVRKWVNDSTALYVVTGPILTENLPTIGENQVSIPAYYYKALLRKCKDKFDAIAFVMPNASSNLPLLHFAISIDSLESLTRINFFHHLPDSIERRVESRVCRTCW